MGKKSGGNSGKDAGTRDSGNYGASKSGKGSTPSRSTSSSKQVNDWVDVWDKALKGNKPSGH